MTQTLITRLSELDAPDRGMDAEIEVAVRRIEAARSGLAEEYWANWQASQDGTVYDPHTRYSSQPFTASVDAVIALAERVLPGKGIDLLREAISELGKKYHWHICLKKPEQVKELPIQVCIALLRAKEASNAPAR